MGRKGRSSGVPEPWSARVSAVDLGNQSADARIPVTIMVVTVGEWQGTIAQDPVFEVDLLILRSGGPAEPLATSLRVPLDLTKVFEPGVRLPGQVSPSDPSVLDVDWSALGN